MQEKAHQEDAAPWISKDPWITEEKGKLINRKGGGVGVCAPSFQDLKVIGIRKNRGRKRVPVP